MVDSSADIETLSDPAFSNDRVRTEELLVKLRPGLRRMVSVRFNSRLARRVDPSELVQEALDM